MKIISADSRHISMLQSIAGRTWPEAYGAILAPAQIRYMLDLFYSDGALQRQLESGHSFYLLEGEDDPIGFAGFEHGHQPGATKLHKLYVLPGIQGRGAGYRLLEAVKGAARQAGDEWLILNVNRHNKARDFYERNGFTVVREADIDIGGGYFMNDYIMECRL